MYMQRYFITLSYDGNNYHGWQIQPNGSSIQETLEKALTILLRQPISIIGAGRTDTGVHARMMVAHFDMKSKFDNIQISYRLNRLLPHDISVSSIIPVSNDMHARFSAIKRTYHYYLHLQKDIYNRQYSCYVGYNLNFDLMNEAALYLIGKKDFKCFCKTGADVKTTICNITEAYWKPIYPELSTLSSTDIKPTNWCFIISANRFLRNMVRAIVGTLIAVGRGKMSITKFKTIVDTGSRSDAGESMPGNALFLWDIEY